MIESGGKAHAAADPPTTRRLVAALLVLGPAGFGLLEAVLQLTVMRQGLHRPIMGDARMLWMVPLGLMVLLTPVAVLLALWAGSRARAVPLVATTLLLGIPIWSVFLLEPNLHWAALGVLAAGVAVSLGRPVARAPERWTGRLGRGAVGMILVLCLIAAGLAWAHRAAERRAIAALPSPSGPDLPNVLLLVWDTVREQDLSVAGYARRTTPGLEQLAREGVRFSEAFATAPWTLPSHGTLFTGFLEQEMVVGHKIPLGIAGPTLAEVLGKQGYLSAGFAANQTYAGYEYGVNRGFAHFEDYHVSPLTVLAAPKVVRLALDPKEALGPFARSLGYRAYPWRKSATAVRSDLVSWLDRRDTGRPFFAFVNFFDAHAPYNAPAPFDTAFGGRSGRRIQVLTRRTPAAVVDQEHRAYDGAIAYIDRETTTLLGQLEARGLLDRTLVIIVADHGESFGEQGVFYHASSLYREQLQVPLMFLWPGRVPAGLRVDAPVSLRDLPSTVYDLLGLPGASPFPGTSLSRFWAAAPAPPGRYRLIAGETTWSGNHGNAIIEDGLYFIAWPGRPQQLFTFLDDSSQSRDLSGDSAHVTAMARNRALDDSLTRRVLEVRGGRFAESHPSP